MTTDTELFTAEEIEENFNTFRAWCEKTGERAPKVLEMVDVLGTNLAICPASSKPDYHLPIPGGLVKHSLNVLENAVKIRRAFKWNIPDESLILCTLFHDIGKVGHVERASDGTRTIIDTYVDAEEWKQRRFQEKYRVNPDMPKWKIPQLSVFLMQEFEIRLSRSEYLAILLNDGWCLEENKDYGLRVEPLVICVQQADYISTCIEGKRDLGF